MLRTQRLGTGSNRAAAPSLPSSFPVRLSINSEASVEVTLPMAEKAPPPKFFPTQSAVDAGKSALIRALTHLIDDDAPASEADFEKARAHFSEAISLMRNLDDPESLGSVYGLRGVVGLLWNAINRDLPLEQAAADFEKSGELLPMETTYILLGHTHWQLGAPDNAIQSLEKAIELNPLCAEAYLIKGLFHQERGETDLAHEDIYWAISLNPDLYEEKFEPIMESERKAQEKWDELYSEPDTKEAFRAWADEANANDLAGKTSTSPSGHK